MTFRETVAKIVYPEVFLNFDKARSDIQYYKVIVSKMEDESLKYAEEIAELNEELANSLPKESPLDEFLTANFKVIENIRYKQKRKFIGKDIDTELNQYITPNQFEVKKLRRRLALKGETYEQVSKTTDWLAKNTTWTSDKNLDSSGDYYLYAEETLVYKQCDCEDVHFALASVLPEQVGVGYGFLTRGDQKFGHAFGIFVWNDKLWVAEATGTKAILKEYENSDYYIHYIITQNKTYELDGSVRFGTLAGWN